MSILSADSVTLLRATAITDKYGNPTGHRDWQNAARTHVSGVSVQPDGTQNSLEETADRRSVITGWRLFTRKGVNLDLLSTDRVEYDGMTLEVDGEVGRYRVAGRVHHIEARLRRVSG